MRFGSHLGWSYTLALDANSALGCSGRQRRKMSGRDLLVELIVLALTVAPILGGCKVVIRRDSSGKPTATTAAQPTAEEDSWLQQTATLQPPRGSTPAWRMRVLPSLTPSLTPTPTATPTFTATPTPTATATPVIYLVQKGDTLKAIAERYGITVVAIMAQNDLGHPNQLRAGDRLVIPLTPVSPAPASVCASPTVAPPITPTSAPLSFGASGGRVHTLLTRIGGWDLGKRYDARWNRNEDRGLEDVNRQSPSFASVWRLDLSGSGAGLRRDDEAKLAEREHLIGFKDLCKLTVCVAKDLQYLGRKVRGHCPAIALDYDL